MDQTITSLRCEIGVFLHNLRAYSRQTNIEIDKKTSEMLSDTLKCIGDLLAGAHVVNNSNEIDTNFLMEIDDRYFELRRNIVCRLCIETMPITKEDFEAHKRKISHGFQMRDRYASIQRQSETQSPEKLDRSKAITVGGNWKLESNKAFEEKNMNTSDKKEDLVKQKTTTMKIPRMNYDSAAEIQRRRDCIDQQVEMKMRDKFYEQRKKEEQRQKAESLENILDDGWKGVRVMESSASDDDESTGFNFDSLYLIEMQGLPLSTTRKDIKNFLQNIPILNELNGIHFILENERPTCGRALVQLCDMREYQAAQKFSQKRLGNNSIEVKAGDVVLFKKLYQNGLIPSKERVVFLDGLPRTWQEKNIRKIFLGLSIGRVHLTSCNNGAYVEFQNINDMEDALKCTEKKHDIRIYRSTKKMMFWCIKNESKYPFSSLLQHSNESSLKSPDSNYYLSIHGLPLEANEESILNMFPGLEIEHDGIQIDRQNPKNPTAFVAFKNPSDFELALNTGVDSKYGSQIKVTKAKKSEYLIAKNKDYMDFP